MVKMRMAPLEASPEMKTEVTGRAMIPSLGCFQSRFASQFATVADNG